MVVSGGFCSLASSGAGWLPIFPPSASTPRLALHRPMLKRFSNRLSHHTKRQPPAFLNNALLFFAGFGFCVPLIFSPLIVVYGLFQLFTSRLREPQSITNFRVDSILSGVTRLRRNSSYITPDFFRIPTAHRLWDSAYATGLCTIAFESLIHCCIVAGIHTILELYGLQDPMFHGHVQQRPPTASWT